MEENPGHPLPPIKTVRAFPGEGPKLYAGNAGYDCVLRVLQVFVEDAERNMLFLDTAAYRRMTPPSEPDPAVVLPENRLLRVRRVVCNRQSLTFSFLCMEEVFSIQDGKPVQASRPRTFSFAHLAPSGELVLNFPSLEAILSPDAYGYLRPLGVLADDTGTHVPNQRYTLRFPGERNLPVVSRGWANPRVMRLVDLLRLEKELEIEREALSKRLRELVPQKPMGGRKKVNDGHLTRCLQIRIMERIAHKPHTESCANLTYDQAEERLFAVKETLRVLRFRVRLIILAWETYPMDPPMVAWGPAVEVKKGRTKTPRMIQEGVLDGATLQRVSWIE